MLSIQFPNLFALLASTTFLIIAIPVVFLVIGYLLEFEKEGWATTIFSLSLFLLIWVNKDSVVNFLTNNPFQTIGFILTYIIAGVVWSLVKWRFYVYRIFEKLKKIKEGVIKKYGLLNESSHKIFISRLDAAHFMSGGNKINFYDQYDLNRIVEEVMPSANDEKTKIVSWIAYWPMSLLATLLNDPFRRFFEYIYEVVSGLYDKIVQSYKKDLLA
jgi:hypothetical protein